MVKNAAFWLWNKSGLVDVHSSEKGFFYFVFDSCSSRDNVIDLDPWHIGGQPIIMRKWQRMLKLSKDTVKDIPVWVKFYNVPFEFWDEEVLTV